MNNKAKIFMSVCAGCSVLMDIMTPIAIALFWGYFFNLNLVASTLVLIIGGLATLFRAFKIGWLK